CSARVGMESPFFAWYVEIFLKPTVRTCRKPPAIFSRGYVFREKAAKGGSVAGIFVVTSGASGL
ncbi:MAG: hypothetical protein MUQ67_01170, partial [Pirellulales bacterium]|nr:hypothetical protein [Pirellulales bacterium]